MSAESLFYTASRLAAAGRHSEAAEKYARSLEINPKSWTAWENYGICLSDDRRKLEAANAFSEAIQLVPQRSESYSLLARTLYETGKQGSGAEAFAAALSLAPDSAALHYEVARTDQLFGRGDAAAAYFASAQRLAYSAWHASMGCDGDVGAWHGGPTRWAEAASTSGAVLTASTWHPTSSAEYGRAAPSPYAAHGWPRSARLRWPRLLFADRGVRVAELEEVWISGNDGVVSDATCGVYLPSHGHQVPLHLNLPHERVSERERDGSIRRVGFGEDQGEGGEGRVSAIDDDKEEEVVVVCLTQLFAANFYSFVADSLARLVVALDVIATTTSRSGRRRRLVIGLPADGGRLKPWMWSLLQRLGVGRHNSFPYSIRPYDGSGKGDGDGMKRAAAARVYAKRLLVVDWDVPPGPAAEACTASEIWGDAAEACTVSDGHATTLLTAAPHRPPPAVDYAHLPSRAALRLLRSRLAFPGAQLAYSSRRHTVVYLQRVAASTRRIADEAALLTALGRTARGFDATFRILSDAPPLRLTDAIRLLARAVCVVGVHGVRSNEGSNSTQRA